ncbi:MAG: triose-phosphate isomerase family protein [Candidatus Moraniibacteriota bacterium]
MTIKEKRLIIANFKMYLSDKAQVDQWLRNFEKASRDLKPEDTKLVLCPPSMSLSRFAEYLREGYLNVGAQDCFWEEEGAFTGALGAKMISSYGGKFVILGHSERRRYFAETDEQVALKVKIALKNRLHPVVCVGENATQKRQEETKEVLLNKLDQCLKYVGKGSVEELVLCYEPIWAISANNPDHLPSANELMEAKVLMKKFLVNKYGASNAERVKIIYGGSIDSGNYEEICTESGMEGALVGSAGKMPYELVKIIKIADKN